MDHDFWISFGIIMAIALAITSLVTCENNKRDDECAAKGGTRVAQKCLAVKEVK